MLNIAEQLRLGIHKLDNFPLTSLSLSLSPFLLSFSLFIFPHPSPCLYSIRIEKPNSINMYISHLSRMGGHNVIYSFNKVRYSLRFYRVLLPICLMLSSMYSAIFSVESVVLTLRWRCFVSTHEEDKSRMYILANINETTSKYGGFGNKTSSWILVRNKTKSH